MIHVDQLSIDEYKLLLPELHKQLLTIAIEIKRICVEHKIPYFLIGGTLLGAVRHQGFIPWDDDMDIGFLRDDYERFRLVCKTELRPEFTLITTGDGNFGLPFSKVLKKKTALIEKNAPQYNCGNGIFVDIFPLDRIPDAGIQRIVYQYNMRFFRSALMSKCGYQQSFSYKKKFVDLYSKIHSSKFIVDKLNHVATQFNHTQTRYFYNTGTAYSFGKEVFPEHAFTRPLPEMLFEGVSFKVPCHSEEILRLLYGDYMTLPPEDKRYNRHSIVAIDFGNT